MTDTAASARPSGRTMWRSASRTPLRRFLGTQSGSASVLLAAVLVALAWANLAGTSYDRLWSTELAFRLGDAELGQDLRGWVNNGLMTFFFFVIGLEARREFDMGELRERQRLTLPLLAGLGGMALPVALFFVFNGGGAGGHGWGVAMSTDTAFALGLLALVGNRFPDRLRVFMLTVVVVDDLVALAVIAVVYSGSVSMPAALTAGVLLALVLVVRALSVRSGLLYAVLGVAAWGATFRSGIDPLVVGLAMGLVAYAYPAGRSDLEIATERFRLFREQPTPALARQARIGVQTAISPNERLQLLFHPWTSYVIVPLFALANAGIALGGGFLGRALTSPITVGIVVAFVLGKPVGIVGVSWLVTRLSRGALRPPVGWLSVAGGGAIAGVGFTVSLLIASLAFEGQALQEAKVGVLAAAVLAATLTWLLSSTALLLPAGVRRQALLGSSATLVDLAEPVDVGRDHIRGPHEAVVTLVEYGDLECPHCGEAEPIVRQLIAEHGELRYVWRHLPLTDVHPAAQLAAEATEAAAAQGAFWEMHDLLLTHQNDLGFEDLVGYAAELGLDRDRFAGDLAAHAGAARVACDVQGADLSGVAGTPTFFINGRRHHGAYDIDALTAGIRRAAPVDD